MSAIAGQSEQTGLRGLLQSADVRYFLAGTTVSMIGDNALWLTLSIWVKVLTGSTSAAGLSIFMLTLGLMTAPLTGVVVDRVRRRPVMITVNALAGLLVATLLFVQSKDQLWLIFIVMFGYGVATAMTSAAQGALTQTLVPETLLGQANSVTQTISQGSRLVTPLLCAGVFAATGAKPIVLADCATFVIAIGLLLRIRADEPEPAPATEHWLRDLTAGVRHLSREPLLRASCLATMIAISTLGLAETVIYAVVDQGLHRSPPFLGVLTSAQGLGAIVGGLTAARIGRRLGELRLIALGVTATGLSFLLQTLPNLVPALIGFGLMGLSISYLVVGTVTLLQLRTPSGLMGRAGAAFNFITTVPQTAAIAVGAGLIAVIPYQALLVAMAVADALAAGYLMVAHRDAEPGV